MSIINIQRNILINDIINDEIDTGSSPSFESISTKLIDKAIDNQIGKPLFNATTQKYKKPYNIDTHNTNTKNLIKDFTILEYATKSIISDIKYNYQKNKIIREKYKYELDKLYDEINELFLLSENSEGYINSVYDTFIDSSKVDLKNSTPNILDLSVNSVSLGPVNKSFKIIPLSFNYDLPQNINVTADNQTYLGRNVYGTSFKNIFDYESSGWMYQVTVNDATSVELSFKLTVNKTNISMLKLISNMQGSSLVSVYYDTLQSSNRQPINGDYKFQLNNIHKLRIANLDINNIYIKIQKDKPDAYIKDGSETRYQYVFGLKFLGIFSGMSYKSGTFYSKPFDINGNYEKISLDVEDIVPNNSKIEYYIKKGNGDWSNIIPSNYEESTKDTSIINLNNISKKGVIYKDFNILNKDSYKITNTSINGQNYYYIPFNGNNYSMDNDVIDNTVVVNRGYGAWSVNNSNDTSIFQRTSSYKFNKNNTITIYASSDEDEFIVNSVKDVTLSSIDLQSDNAIAIEGIGNDYIVDYTKSTIEGINNANTQDKTYDNQSPYGTLPFIVVTKLDNSNFIDDSNIQITYTLKRNSSYNLYTTYLKLKSTQSLLINKQTSDDVVYINNNIENNTELTFEEEYIKITLKTIYYDSNDNSTNYINSTFSVKENNEVIDLDKIEKIAFIQPMNQVSKDYLINNSYIYSYKNTLEGTKEYPGNYAIVKLEGKSYIVINYWPSDSDNGLNIEDAFDIDYKYIDNTPSENILLKAELTSDDGVNIPSISKYSIKMGLNND